MKAVRWVLMLVFTVLVLTGLQGGSAKAGGPPCGNSDDPENENHRWMYYNDKDHVNKAATCTEPGYKWLCCGNPELHKQWMDDNREAYKANGYYDEWMIEVESPYYGCFGGFNNNIWKKETIPAIGGDHNWVLDSNSPQKSCTQTVTQTYTCSKCGAKKEERVEPYPSHDFVKDEKASSAATCERAGMECTICSHCGSEGPSTPVAALGHDFSVKVETVAPTCQNRGYTLYKCSRCDKTEMRDYVETTGKHTLQESVIKAATCTADGEKQIFCTVCDYNVREKIPALGHDWGVGATKAATCLQDGYEEKICKRCGTEGERKTIPATGHNWVSEVVLKKPTCEEPGEEEMKCTKCGTEGPRQEIPALGHDWDEGVVTKEPAVYVEGEKTYTCKNDPSHTKVEKIPALPDENGNITPPDGDGQNGENGNGQDGQNGQNGQNGENGNGQDGQNGDGSKIDGSTDGNGNGNGNGANGDGSGTGQNGTKSDSSQTKKKSKFPWILLIILLILAALAAVVYFAIKKMKR